MFERFTDRARRIVVLAQEEARLREHNYIGTEHIFLGLVVEAEGVAAKVLADFDVSTENARAAVSLVVPNGATSPSGHIPFTPDCKRALELSLREALLLGHNYIGTEHVLLGLIRGGGDRIAQVFAHLDLDQDEVRMRVIETLPEGTKPAPAPEPSPRVPVEMRRMDVEKALAWINAYRLISIPDPFWPDHYLRPLWEVLNKIVVKPEE